MTALDTKQLALLLRELYHEQDQRTRAEYKRSLPLADGLYDRWERARSLGFGEGASIYHSAHVFGEVEVGAHSWIGPNVVLDGSGGKLTIGSYCSVSSAVHVYTHDTVRWALSGGRLPYRTQPISIGNNVYIGAQCVIAAGVTIGDRCLISANSLVIDDVPTGTIAGGAPAKPIGFVRGVGEAVQLEWNHKDGSA